MKKVINDYPVPLSIDWHKPQWLISNINPDVIALSTGRHSLEYFTGTILPCERYPNGSYSNDWRKDKFELLTKDIPFIISNND